MACQGGLMGSMVSGTVAEGLLAFRWEVEESGGDEVGGFEDLEVALGGVAAFGAVDDVLAGGVPGFLCQPRVGIGEIPPKFRNLKESTAKWDGSIWS